MDDAPATMSLDDALDILDSCHWLKITAHHVSASKWKSRVEQRFAYEAAVQAHRALEPSDLRAAAVSTRRKKHETFAMLLIRAATLVQGGHVPIRRVQPLTHTDRCACGTESHDLVWNHQLKQRLCRRCDIAWANAARSNDMRPIKADIQPQ